MPGHVVDAESDSARRARLRVRERVRVRVRDQRLGRSPFLTMIVTFATQS
jgi:hypothetical protein